MSQSRTTKKQTKSRQESLSGIALQEILGDSALAVLSPAARRMSIRAKACGKEHLEFVQLAIGRQLINDTLDFLRGKSSVVTIESLISATMGGEKNVFKADRDQFNPEEAGIVEELLNKIHKQKKKYADLDKDRGVFAEE